MYWLQENFAIAQAVRAAGLIFYGLVFFDFLFNDELLTNDFRLYCKPVSLSNIRLWLKHLIYTVG